MRFIFWCLALATLHAPQIYAAHTMEATHKEKAAHILKNTQFVIDEDIPQKIVNQIVGMVAAGCYLYQTRFLDENRRIIMVDSSPTHNCQFFSNDKELMAAMENRYGGDKSVLVKIYWQDGKGIPSKAYYQAGEVGPQIPNKN